MLGYNHFLPSALILNTFSISILGPGGLFAIRLQFKVAWAFLWQKYISKIRMAFKIQ